MVAQVWTIGFVVVCALLAGCNPPATDKAELDEIRKRLDLNEKTLANLQRGQTELKRQLLLVNLDRTKHKAITLDPAERTYERIDHDTGFFYVSFQNVQPYGDGQRITLHIGNPLMATFVNVELEVEWSPRFPERKEGMSDDDFQKLYQAYVDATHKKTVRLDKKIEQGSWNTVQFVIAPAPADKFGVLEIASVKTSTVELVRR
jgi:hypothetical protein